jgi:hypothetical protein
MNSDDQLNDFPQDNEEIQEKGIINDGLAPEFDLDQNEIRDDEESLQDLPSSEVVEDDASDLPIKEKKKRWVLLALLFAVIVIGISVFLGYRNGVQRRIQNERSMLMDQISLQLDWAYRDIDEGRYENAKTRLEYIIDKYPGFPGIDQLLVDVMMKMEAPTAVPTAEFVIETLEPEITPTVDTRAAEETFAQIEQNIANEEWDQAIQNIQSLKESNYDYKTIAVDGYYFIALRNRGIQRIWAGELEQGMYDLSVAEQLGALDNVAAGARNWASLYMTGASYWDVNWSGAVEIFGQLYAQLPYFSDASGMSSAERYRIALYRLGDQYAASGDYCTASSYYQQSLSVGGNLDIEVTATWLADVCANPPGEETPEPTEEPDANATPAPDVTEEAPTETP